MGCKLCCQACRLTYTVVLLNTLYARPCSIWRLGRRLCFAIHAHAICPQYNIYIFSSVYIAQQFMAGMRGNENYAFMGP